jgi:hypothetical protein
MTDWVVEARRLPPVAVLAEELAETRPAVERLTEKQARQAPVREK